MTTFGFYTDVDEIRQLLEPFLDMLDGRNDMPYPMIAGEGI